MWWWAIRLLRMDRQGDTTTSAETVQRCRCYWARLLFSRSQPPRRAASRCCASRDTTCRGSATMRGKCCVDSHAFRDEGKLRFRQPLSVVYRRDSSVARRPFFSDLLDLLGLAWLLLSFLDFFHGRHLSQRLNLK